ncbi:MAG TPA: putative metal-dependent hydrolase [Bryobacteraceae bacterium]|nr:putative metal-dependent hydrolase [Bryobacteraceae bacterium]
MRTMSDARYPVGKFEWPATITAEDRKGWIETVAATPAKLREAVEGLSEEQLNTPYREGGWTVRQLVHHVPDSHMNSYVRFKLALTENEPTIKTYDEAAWAKLQDTVMTPIETSLCLLQCIHERWVHVLEGMTEGDWSRNLIHPELGKITLEKMLALYAWHGRHHVAHVTSLRSTQGW